MQNNNNIADQLDTISKQIRDLDSTDISVSATQIQTAYLEIEKVAREYELTTLLALVHWVNLNTELEKENTDQVTGLIKTNSYSNWIDVLVNILNSYNDNLRPALHHSLTSPEWIVKPSTILLKDVALWVTTLKLESEEELNQMFDDVISEESNIENKTDENNESDGTVDKEKTIEENQTEKTELIDDIIENQVLKAEQANEESLVHQTVFEKIDRDIVEKDYTEEVITEVLGDELENKNNLVIPLIESEKSSLDDEAFEAQYSNPSELDITLLDTDMLAEDDLISQNNKLVESTLNIDETDTSNENTTTNDDMVITGENKFDNINFEIELTDIHNALTNIHISTSDVYSAKDQFIKQLDRIILITENTNMKAVVPVVYWCQQNIKLFEDNSTSSIEQFIISGKSWSWIEQIIDCLRGSDKNECLANLSDSLMHKDWLEPLAADDLKALLEGLNTTLEHGAEETVADTNNESLKQESNDEELSTIDELPELLDNPIAVESNTEETTQEIKEELDIPTSGLNMTWDDDTHPELLTVYLEETPSQVKELLPLLDKMSLKQADKKDKQTASRLVHTIKGASAIVGITALADLTSPLEELLDHSVTHKLTDEITTKLPEIGKCVESTFNAVQLQQSEPSEFLSIITLLNDYSYDLDEELTEESSSIIEENIDDNSENADSIKILSSNNSNENTEVQALVTNKIEDTEIIDDKVEEIANDAELQIDTDVSELDNILSSIETDNKADPVTESKDVIENLKETNEIEKTEETEMVTEEVITEKSNFKMTWDDDTHPELLMVYLEETPTQLNELVPLLHKISEGKADSDEKHTASRMAHTIKGGSAIVGLTTLSEISYRLETLLDHSVKHTLPESILDILPNTATCLDNLFEAIQMQEDEPEEYLAIFNTLDTYVDSIDEQEDETLELPTIDLPDFIVNQNKASDSSDVVEEDSTVEEKVSDELADTRTDTSSTSVVKDDKISTETKTVEAEKEDDKDTAEQSETETEETKTDLEIESKSEESETIVEETEAIAEENAVKDSLEVETASLDKLHSKDDINNIIVEIDDIVLNLISYQEIAKDSKAYAKQCIVELDRFELITDLSGYPELSLLSQWCQTNLEKYAKRKHKKFTGLINSNEIWSWIEHVGSCLRESDDMSHMSSLSVELMREEWLLAIKMEDLQTVLLALRHIEDTGVAAPAETPTESKSKSTKEVISWDKDVHPELLSVYFQETPDQIDNVAALLHKISRGESTSDENKEAARIAHTIKGSSGVVGLTSLLNLTHYLEDILDYSVNNKINTETAELLSESSDCMESLFETIQNKQAPPDELDDVLERLSTFSNNLENNEKDIKNTKGKKSTKKKTPAKTKKITAKSKAEVVESVIDTTSKPDTSSIVADSTTSNVDTNEAFIRVPIKVIDRLLNLAGELVTTSNLVSDNLAKTQETTKTIRGQDERIITMLGELNTTIEKQEKDQQHLLSSIDNSELDSLEMDTYNELNSVASLLTESVIDGQEIDSTLNKQLDELTEKLHSLDKLNKTFSDVILSSRMVSVDTIIPRLERIVRQTCRKTNKKARLKVTGNNINIDTDILNNLVDPLLHMLRNSVDHGIETPSIRKKKKKDETGTIELTFSREGNNILMTLTDDGAGINAKKIQKKAIEKELISADQKLTDNEVISLILQPGFTTQDKVTDISGRGVGMDVVNTSIQELNGILGIDSDLGKGTSFKLSIPLTLITNTTLLVNIEDNLIAIPTDTIAQIMYQEANTLIEHDNEFYVEHEGKEIKTRSLGELLHWPHQKIDPTRSYNILLIKVDDEINAVHVDDIDSSREVVVKRLSPWVSPAKGVIGACHLTDGGVAPVINLITVVKENIATQISNKSGKAAPIIITPDVKKQILVVDDSLSNRKALSLIIEKTDYDVVTAVDGLDALRVMNEQNIDIVFTDLEMPRMNGLELTQSIRAWKDKSKTPVVMITSRTTTKHRELASKAGVDDYLTKPVENKTLLKSIDTWLTKKEAVEA